MWACIENIECKFCWSILTHPRLDKNGKENPMTHWSQYFPGRQPLFLAAWSWRPQESSAATIRSSINSCADVGRVVENPQLGWRVSPWWRVDLGVEFFPPQKRRIWATIWVSPSWSCMTHEEFSYWIHECVLFAWTHRASGCPFKSGSATSLLYFCGGIVDHGWYRMVISVYLLGGENMWTPPPNKSLQGVPIAMAIAHRCVDSTGEQLGE